MMGVHIPGVIKPYDLGENQHHVVLHAILSNYEFGKFWVTDKASEEQLEKVRRLFDQGKHKNKNMILHNLLRDGDHDPQLRLLLSIGVHPDLACTSKIRPSNYTTRRGRPACARALGSCRPDLSAVDDIFKSNPMTISVSFINPRVNVLVVYITLLH